MSSGTAVAIARELGIASDDRVVSAAQLELMSDQDLAATTREVAVYARVNPEHKLRVVDALQSNGEIVAMTGDGVKDAPALKSADIGVAMGITGTDVSKEAADPVLTDDNFATIVVAVEEGRAVFDNIRKFLRYLLSSNAGEVLTVFFSVVLAGPLGLGREGMLVLPLLATQILWINLLTDGAPALALGVDPADPDLMSQPPRLRSEGVIDRGMRAGIGPAGVVMAAGRLLIFDAALPGGWVEGSGGMEYGRTMAFTTLMLFPQSLALGCCIAIGRAAYPGYLRSVRAGRVRNREAGRLGLGTFRRSREQRVMDCGGGEIPDQAAPCRPLRLPAGSRANSRQAFTAFLPMPF